MILRNENMLDTTHDYKLFTANSTLTKNGELVMGAGIAKQVKLRHAELPKVFGNIIAERRNKKHYLILWDDFPYIPFQTKVHWKDKSDLELIVAGLRDLYMRAMREANKSFALNMPGVGLGGLKLEDVIPYVALMPNNVYIYTNFVGKV